MLLDNGSALSIPAQGLAELVPQVVNSYYYPDHLGMELERSFALYGEIYMRNNWVRACIDKWANAIAQLPVEVWDVDGDTPVLDKKSQYAKLMAQPCDYLDNHTFWLWVSTTYKIYGETYLAMARQDPGDPTSAPINLMPMHPSRVAIRRDAKTARYTYLFLAGVYGTGDGLVEFPQEDVVPFRTIHPHKLERGLSKLESLKSTIFAEDASRNATSAMWRNAGRPNVILQHPDAISPAALKRLQQQFDQAHAGSSNTGKTLVVEEGMQVSSFQLSAQDMEWVSSRQLNREEVCGVLDTPPPMVGIHDHSTYCLPADTQISTQHGPKDIVDVRAGEKVWAFDGQKMVLSEVSWSGQTGTKATYTLKTANRTLRATGNHPVLVARFKWVHGSNERKTRSYRDGHEYVYVPVDQLRVGDLLVSAHAYATGTKREEAPNGRALTARFMEFCGLLMGDGNVHASRTSPGVSIAHHKDATYIEHYHEAARQSFTNRYGKPVHWVLSDRSSRFASASAVRELTELGFSGTAHTKSIPGWVFETSEEMRFSFLRGIIEADGHVSKKGHIAFSLCNRRMVHQVRDMMMGLGIPVTNVSHSRREVKLPNGKLVMSEMWKVSATSPVANCLIGSWDDEDMRRMAEGPPWHKSFKYGDKFAEILPPEGGRLARLLKIEKSEEAVPVYDLTVPGTHSFVADGVVVHNSNITELLRGFYRDTVNPDVRFFASVMNRYVGDWWARKNAMRFAVDEMIRGDYEKLAEVARALVATGVMTPNEARSLMGLNRIDDEKANQLSNLADRLYANSAMQPLGAPAEQIRLIGQIEGQTPDGTQLTTPIASPSGGMPQTIPAVPHSNSQESSPKHLRAVKGVLGRGDDIKAFAMQLAEKHPDDLDDILAAVKLAIESKGNTHHD